MRYTGRGLLRDGGENRIVVRDGSNDMLDSRKRAREWPQEEEEISAYGVATHLLKEMPSSTRCGAAWDRYAAAEADWFGDGFIVLEGRVLPALPLGTEFMRLLTASFLVIVQPTAVAGLWAIT